MYGSVETSICRYKCDKFILLGNDLIYYTFSTDRMIVGFTTNYVICAYHH